MKAGDLYRIKEEIQYYDQPPVPAGSIFMIVEVKGRYMVDVLVGEQIQTWDTWGLEECMEPI